ncbi:MAG: Serine/threonine-protein kinase PrkC [Planctomycetota bacterium]
MKSPEDRPVNRPPPPPPPRRPAHPGASSSPPPALPSQAGSIPVSRTPPGATPAPGSASGIPPGPPKRGGTAVAPGGGGANVDTNGPVVASQPTVVAASSGSAWQFLGHDILRELDRGGLGVVFLARHAMLHELRAIKRPLDHETLDSASVVERFKREVRAVGLLKNEHVIRAHDAGIDQYGPYLVMEYLEGLPISKLVGRLGPLPIPLACELARQAALGLHAAYERGLVHRDIKPSNLMLARHDTGARIVVIDWGLVKGVELSAPPGSSGVREVTVLGTTMGTLGYMSPEQCRGESTLDSRADIYSLGVTLGCLLTGRAATDWVDGIPGVVNRSGELPRIAALRALRSELPEDLLSVLGKMVDDHAARRFPHPGSAAEALALWTARVTPPVLLDLLTAKSPSDLPPLLRKLSGSAGSSAGSSPASGGTGTRGRAFASTISLAAAPVITAAAVPVEAASGTSGGALPRTDPAGPQSVLLVPAVPAVAAVSGTPLSALAPGSHGGLASDGDPRDGSRRRSRWSGGVAAFVMVGVLGLVALVAGIGFVAFGMLRFRQAIPGQSPGLLSGKSDGAAGEVASVAADWAYAEDFSNVKEGGLPAGWKGAAFAVQPDDSGKPSMVIVEPSGVPTLAVPPPAARADFDLELDYRIHGHTGAGYLGQKQSQLLGVKLIQDASRSVRVELQPDGEVVAADRFPRIVAAPPSGRPATSTISRRGDLLAVAVMGLTATALRLPADFQVNRVEFDMTAGRVTRLNSDYARLYGIRLAAPVAAGKPASAEPLLGALWLDERFLATPLGDLPTGWLGPQFAVLHDSVGKPCLQVTAAEGQHEIRIPALSFDTPWFVDVECSLNGHDGSGFSGSRQQQRLRFLFDAVDATTVDVDVGPDGGVSIDNGPERSLNTAPRPPARLSGSRAREPLRCRVEFTGEFLRVLVNGREVNRLNREQKWPRFQSLRLALTAGAAFRVSPEPAMIYRVAAGKLDAE